MTLRQLLDPVIKILQMSLKAKKERELALESTKEKERSEEQENNNGVYVKQILFDWKDSFYSEKKKSFWFYYQHIVSNEIIVSFVVEYT